MALLLGLCGGIGVAAAQTEWRGVVELEGRHFRVDQGNGLTGSVAGLLDIYQPTSDRDLSLIAELFYREDLDDPRRSHGDARQAYIQALGRELELYAGWRRIFWGVTEARSLVDTINQTDLVEDIDGGAKLGQPMVQLRWLAPVGTIDGFLLAGTRARTFPGQDGFPRIPFPIARRAARFPDGEQQRLDYALRWQFRAPGLDLGLSWFDGTARDPDFLPCLAEGSDFPGTDSGPNCNLQDAVPEQPLPGLLVDLLQALRLTPSDAEVEADIQREVMDNLVLIPDYPRERRAGLDLQYLRGGLALRLEALLRERAGIWSRAAVAGAEYTLPGFFATGWDVSALFEYLYDERDNDVFTQRFTDDLFFGTRLSLNDLAGSVVLAGVIVEPDFGNRLFSLEASRRLWGDWRLTADVRVFSDLPDDPLVDLIDGQDRVRLLLQRFF